MSLLKLNHTFGLLTIATCSLTTAATVIEPSQSVMTSSFFQGNNQVRGYAGDNRPVFRVSSDNPFGTSGAETIYLDFTSFVPGNLTEPVTNAVLSVTSISGGFSADASVTSPFLVSAHGVNANPFSSITEDTNLNGTTDWLSFYSNNIHAATSSTSIDSFGVVNFDVTNLVNDWVSEDNNEFFIALTGTNDTSGGEFLHGFSNNTEVAGATFLTINPVPEPSSTLLVICGLTVGLTRRKRH